MRGRWHADITNDPQRDFALCIEVYEEDSIHRATVRRDAKGDLVIVWHPAGPSEIEVPAKWLRDVLDRADRELP